jgi:hypothetical protein
MENLLAEMPHEQRTWLFLLLGVLIGYVVCWLMDEIEPPGQ